MAANYQPPDGEDGALSSLNEAIDALNLAKGSNTITPAKAAFSAVTTLLSTISKVCFHPLHVDQLLDNVYRTRWSTKWTLSNWV